MSDDPIKMKDFDVGKRLTCPMCGQQDHFKENQLSDTTQVLVWKGDGYEYQETKFNDGGDGEEIVCGNCGTMVVFNDDTPQEQLNRLIESVKNALACENGGHARKILNYAIARYKK